MIVVSLFDGMSGGRESFKRAGIPVQKYYASEIQESAIAIAKKNYPDNINVGDVRKLKGSDFGKVDILIGGSPCQSFSSVGKRNGMSTEDKQEIVTLEQYLELKEAKAEFVGYSFLFWEYVRLLKEIKPKYFFLENVKMSKKWQDVISKALGCEPIMIDSALVSAQGRKRYYWTNIPNVTQPEDRKIYVEDILDYTCEHPILNRATVQDYDNYDKTKVDRSVHKYPTLGLRASKQFGNSLRNTGKAYTLRVSQPNGILLENDDLRNFTPLECERLQTLPDHYTQVEGLTCRERLAAIGNGWTIEVIAHIFRGLKGDVC